MYYICQAPHAYNCIILSSLFFLNLLSPFTEDDKWKKSSFDKLCGPSPKCDRRASFGLVRPCWWQGTSPNQHLLHSLNSSFLGKVWKPAAGFPPLFGSFSYSSWQSLQLEFCRPLVFPSLFSKGWSQLGCRDWDSPQVYSRCSHHVGKLKSWSISKLN